MRMIMLLALAGCSVSTTDNFDNPLPGPPESCTQIASLTGCDQGSVSYSCSTDRPDDGDPNLICSNGIAGALGATLYCCAPFSQYYTDCTSQPDIAGCSGVAMGFHCDATTPTDADPTIACSAATADGDYCCNTAAPIVTCAIDPATTCTGIAIGYTCAGTDLPFPSGFDCTTQPQTAPGQTSYCCVPSP